jgi:hypothetical protein
MPTVPTKRKPQKRRRRHPGRTLPDFSYLWPQFDGYKLTDIRQMLRDLCADDELWKLLEASRAKSAESRGFLDMARDRTMGLRKKFRGII